MDELHYHPALTELLRAAEAGELDERDLEAVERAATGRHDTTATFAIITGAFRSLGGGKASEYPGAEGFFRALRKALR